MEIYPVIQTGRWYELQSKDSGVLWAEHTNRRGEESTVSDFLTLDYAATQVGEESSFIDLWLDAEQGGQVEGEGVRQGSLIQVENLIPIDVGEQDDVVVRFVSGGVVRRLQGEEARSLATLIDERNSGSQLNMTGVQAVINMVDMDGTFVYESQQASSEVVNSAQEIFHPPSSKLGPPPSTPLVEKSTVLRQDDRTVDISLSPWDPSSQTNQKGVSQQSKHDEMISLSSWNSSGQSQTSRTTAMSDPSNAKDNVGIVGDMTTDEQVCNGDGVESKRLPADEEEALDGGSSLGSASLLLDSQESQVSSSLCQKFK